ncbi:MAG TPA: hypothetical protein PLX06_15825, partial [Fimbriimonadaceae bacterium]|nr:hypothetical protein [Fimbriimonadaceae bacterium]
MHFPAEYRPVSRRSESVDESGFQRRETVVIVQASDGRRQARTEQAHSGWNADRSIAVSLTELRPLVRQTIQVRRSRHRAHVHRTRKGTVLIREDENEIGTQSRGLP